MSHFSAQSARLRIGLWASQIIKIVVGQCVTVLEANATYEGMLEYELHIEHVDVLTIQAPTIGYTYGRKMENMVEL